MENILFDMDAHGKKYIFYFFHSIPAALYPPEFFVAHPAIPVDTLLYSISVDTLLFLFFLAI